MMIISRFAPSPTGYLHIGGARTALFNYLWAKRNGGKFLLRMEDTDKARSTKESADQIMSELKWLGIEWDNEQVQYQSKRLDIYYGYRDELISKNLAYTKDNAIYLKGTDDLDDFVVFKSDGMPTFHFAVVVDDHLMGVNCIIRGVDHLANTLKHKLIYKYLGWEVPKYYHVPLIVDEQGKPLSKRRNDVAVSFYQDNNYFSEAVFNFLARLGWGHKDQEIFSKEELVNLFSIEKVSKSAARFDTKKLNWLNSQYLKRSSLSRLNSFGFTNIKEAVNRIENNKFVDECLSRLQKKAFDLAELDLLLAPFLSKPVIDKDLFVSQEVFIAAHKQNIKQLLESTSNWDLESIEKLLEQYRLDNDLGMKDLMMPLRIILTGHKKSLEVVSIIIYLGKEETLSRLS